MHALDRLLDVGSQAEKTVPLTLANDMVTRTWLRFNDGRDPDGTQWEENSIATLAAYIGARQYRKRDGTVNARGAARLAGKKVLIGESHYLKESIAAEAAAVAEGGAMVKAGAKYAAIHQFGGHAGNGLRIRIPERPYLPVRSDGSLYSAESAAILQSVNDFIEEGLAGLL